MKNNWIERARLCGQIAKALAMRIENERPVSDATKAQILALSTHLEHLGKDCQRFVSDMHETNCLVRMLAKIKE
jgi:hypothetical protein